jgi:2-iminobutanoate/2-iminopropanoate deaminase
MPRQAVIVDPDAKPVGPLSPAVRSGGFVFLSGQIGADPATDELVAGGVGAQTEQAFANLEAVLSAAGKSLDDIVRVGVYLTDPADYPAVNEVYARFFQDPYPARSAVVVAALPLGAAVEIDAIAG